MFHLLAKTGFVKRKLMKTFLTLVFSKISIRDSGADKSFQYFSFMIGKLFSSVHCECIWKPSENRVILIKADLKLITSFNYLFGHEIWLIFVSANDFASASEGLTSAAFHRILQPGHSKHLLWNGRHRIIQRWSIIN